VRLENTQAELLALAEVEVFPRTTDILPPTVTTLNFQSTTNLLATMNFSEALDPDTAANPANYVFTGGPVVSSAALLPSGTTVILTIDKLPPNSAYALRVSGVKDKAGNALVATNFSGTMGFYELNWARGGTASASSTGWGGVPERAIDGGTDSDFNHASVFHSNSQTGDWWEVDLGGTRDVGQVRVWLRTDQNAAPGNSNLTVTVFDESQTEIWRGTYPDNPLTATPATNMFAFTFGPALQARYVRVDNSITPFWFALAEVEVVAPYTNVSLTITKQPVDQVVAENHAATFGPVGATFQGAPQNVLTVQWMANGTNIPGANTLGYTTPILSLTDSEQEFQVAFLYSGVALTSSVVRLTVIPDLEPPLVQAVLPELGPGTVKLRVQFDELIDTTTAGEFWNYTPVNGFLIDSVTLGDDGRSVVLAASGLDALSGYYSLQVENVQDLVGNTIKATNVVGRLPASSVDVALVSSGAVATSSSVGWSGTPERAIDGNTDGDFANNSVCHSAEGDLAPWLNVDFGAAKTIGLVQIWWRTDGGLHPRDVNYTIKLLDEESTVVWSYQFDGLPPYPSAAVAVPEVPARYVQLEPQRNQFLHVAEVEAFEAFASVRLNLQRDGQNVIVSWPDTVTGYVLEATDTLIGGAWKEVSGVVNNSVKLPASTARQFYRLRMP
jgi:hypothetical protein